MGDISHFVYRKHQVLTSNGIVKCLFGEMAGLVRRVENLIVEDGKVQGETEADWMGRSEIRSGDLSSSFVGLQ